MRGLYIMGNKGKKKKCYTYIRVSTTMQVEGYSLDAQKDKLKKYAEFQNMEIVREYCDAGRSGKSITGRPEFTQMLEDIGNERDDIDYVLVFKLSRFGRNAADVLNSLQYIQDYGVNLICVEDGIDSSKDSGKLTITVLSAVAEIERENILIQTMEGRKQKAREGMWSAGATPYGYRLEAKTGKLIVVPEEAEVVKLVFDKFTKEDMSAQDIANYLNSHGYKKKKSREREVNYFQRRLVLNIIDNPVYIGKIVYGRSTSEKVKGTRDQYRRVKTDDYVVADGLHESLIDEETWKYAKMKRDSTRQKWEKTHSLDHEHILSGLIKCPICGKGLSGTVSRHTKKGTDQYKDTFYYRCLHRGFLEDGSKCDFRVNLNQDKFNKHVETAIKLLVKNDSLREYIEMRMEEKADVSRLEEELSRTKEQLTQSKAAKDRLIDNISNLDSNDKHYNRKMEDMQERLDALYDRIADLDDAIYELQNQINGVLANKIAANQVYRILMNFDKLYDKMSDKEKKEFMQYFIERIEIPKEKVTSGAPFTSIKLSFPICYDGEVGDEFCLLTENDVETVCLLCNHAEKATKWAHVTLTMEEYRSIKAKSEAQKKDNGLVSFVLP